MKVGKIRATELLDQKITIFHDMEGKICVEAVFDDDFFRTCDETAILLADLLLEEETTQFLNWAIPSPKKIEDFRRRMLSAKNKAGYLDLYQRHLVSVITLLNIFKDIIIYEDIVRASGADSHSWRFNNDLSTNSREAYKSLIQYRDLIRYDPSILDSLSLSSRELQAGTHIGNYVIGKLLGVGGIGAVYLAQHQFLNQMVAVKVHDFFPADKYVGIAFFRASNYLSQLNHPNIIYLHNYGFESSRAYQIMEYVDGLPLVQVIPNVLLDNHKGIIKLTDFMIPDIQRALGERNFNFTTMTSKWFGTPAYMAPEQLAGNVTQQTDIFSLGVTMYQLLTGHLPYSVKGIQSENGSEIEQREAKPQLINPYMPNWLGEMIAKATKRNPEDRFKTVAEMIRIVVENKDRETASLIINVKEWIMGDQINNQIGDISNVSGQLFIGKFNAVIANLNTSGQLELAAALKTLKEFVMASEHLSNEDKQEQVEVINQIGEEAVKPKPNKTLLKVLGEGLMATLRAIPDMAKAVAAAAPILTQLHL